MSQLFFLTFTTLLSMNLWAETTDTEPQNEISIGSQCLALEEKFQKELVKEIGKGVDNFSELASCFTEKPFPKGHRCRDPKRGRNSIAAPLMEYRKASDKLYTIAYKDWIKSQGKAAKFIENCFGKKPDYYRHYHSLFIRPSKKEQCRSHQQSWAASITPKRAELLNLKQKQYFNANDAKAIKSFEASFYSQFISDATKNNPQMNEEEVEKSLYQDFRRNSENIKNLQKKIATLPKEYLYELYEFESQHETFVTALPKDQRALATQCRDNNNYWRECVRMKDQVKGRCEAREGSFLKDFAPLIGFFDALSSFKDLKAAVAAGIVSPEEAKSKADSFDWQLVLSVPINIGASAGFSKAAKGIKVGRKQYDNVGHLLDRNYKNLSTKERKVLMEYAMTPGLMSNKERLSMAAQALNNPSIHGNSQLGRAIIRAHEACNNNKTGCLRTKYQILQRVGLKRPQIQKLMDRGITGLDEVPSMGNFDKNSDIHGFLLQLPNKNSTTNIHRMDELADSINNSQLRLGLGETIADRRFQTEEWIWLKQLEENLHLLRGDFKSAANSSTSASQAFAQARQKGASLLVRSEDDILALAKMEGGPLQARQLRLFKGANIEVVRDSLKREIEKVQQMNVAQMLPNTFLKKSNGQLVENPDASAKTALNYYKAMMEVRLLKMQREAISQSNRGDLFEATDVDQRIEYLKSYMREVLDNPDGVPPASLNINFRTRGH